MNEYINNHFKVDPIVDEVSTVLELFTLRAIFSVNEPTFQRLRFYFLPIKTFINIFYNLANGN